MNRQRLLISNNYIWLHFAAAFSLVLMCGSPSLLCLYVVSPLSEKTLSLCAIRSCYHSPANLELWISFQPASVNFIPATHQNLFTVLSSARLPSQLMFIAFTGLICCPCPSFFVRVKFPCVCESHVSVNCLFKYLPYISAAIDQKLFVLRFVITRKLLAWISFSALHNFIIILSIHIIHVVLIYLSLSKITQSHTVVTGFSGPMSLRKILLFFSFSARLCFHKSSNWIFPVLILFALISIYCVS